MGKSQVTVTPGPLATALMDEFPEVLNATIDKNFIFGSGAHTPQGISRNDGRASGKHIMLRMSEDQETGQSSPEMDNR